MAQRKKGLGKGLGALLEAKNITVEESNEKVYEIDLNDISPYSDQPRKSFDEEKLAELADSIQANGIIQPLILHKVGDRDYEIVAGERRWRAARMAGLKKVPAIIRELADEERLKQALIENIQREDLNPLEEAAAYQQLLEDYDLNQEELAETIGKSRSAIANTLRLNKLSPQVKQYVKDGKLSQGHARALLTIEDQEIQAKVAGTVIFRNLNVRQTENYVRLFQTKDHIADPEKTTKQVQYQLSVRKVEERLSKALGVKVQLKDKAGRGRIEIPYKNLDELDRLLALLEQERAGV